MSFTLRAGAPIDLHLHSTRSDGTLSPEDLLRGCARVGLELVAITDHDLTHDVPHGEHDFDGHALRLVAGAEISGVHAGRELHLLVYFPGAVPAAFRAFCQAQCRERADRYQQAVTRLDGQLDLTLAGPDDAATQGERALTRLHLAQAMAAAGAVRHWRDAFARYLGDQHDIVPPLSLAFTDAIRIARAHGGLTSWAHPSRLQLTTHLEAFVAAGLQGVEGVRPFLSSNDRKMVRTAARKHQLYVTGGSDWHGDRDGALGTFQATAGEVDDFLRALAAA